MASVHADESQNKRASQRRERSELTSGGESTATIEDVVGPSLNQSLTMPGRQGVSSARTVVRLERLIGNQAVQRLIVGDVAKNLGNDEELVKQADDEEELARSSTASDAASASHQPEVAIETRLAEPGPGRDDLNLAESATALLGKASVSVASGAPPSHALGGAYGLTYPENVVVTISAKKDKAAGTWSPRVKKLLGRYSLQASLLAGQKEITGPAGNTTSANFCAQCENLKSLGNTPGNTWYIRRAVVAHENVHATRFKPGLAKARDAIVTAIEATSVPDIAGMNETAAIKQLQGDPAYQAAVTGAQATWLAEILKLVAGDHAAGGPCDKAERKHTEPLRKTICAHAKKNKWGACPHC